MRRYSSRPSASSFSFGPGPISTALKVLIGVNVATYWHACRMNGINDKLYGFTQLFSRF